MSSTPDSSLKAAHNRWHTKKGILRPHCPLCQVAYKEAGVPLPMIPDKANSARQHRKRLTIAQKLVGSGFDIERARGMAARERTLNEAALIFGISPAELEAEIKQAYGLTWEQLTSRASIALFDEAEEAIWRNAIEGDVRFILLLISLNKLPGWREARPIPMRSILEGGVYSTSGDLRGLSTEQLEHMRKDLNKKALEAVIDRPTTGERLEQSKSLTMAIEDVHDAPAGWIETVDGTFVAVGQK